jgi:hypothetical protein
VTASILDFCLLVPKGRFMIKNNCRILCPESLSIIFTAFPIELLSQPALNPTYEHRSDNRRSARQTFRRCAHDAWE